MTVQSKPTAKAAAAAKAKLPPPTPNARHPLDTPLRADPPVPTENTVTTAKWWRLEVTATFDYAGIHFEPRTVYHVPDDVFTGKLADGRNFKDLCVNTQEEDSY